MQWQKWLREPGQEILAYILLAVPDSKNKGVDLLLEDYH